MSHATVPTARHHARPDARRVLRRWVRRHLVAMDPAPDAGALDRLDGRRP